MLTFALTCTLLVALCIGVSMAIMTGIAYGYHYSLAEFLTFTRQDAAVYIRRGQFRQRPDLAPKLRRTGDDDELFASNSSMDYPDQKTKSDSQPLSDAWSKTQDSKKYAQKLTKYSYQELKKPEKKGWTPGSIFTAAKNVLPIQRQESQVIQDQRPTPIDRVLPPTRILAVPPNLGVPTAIIPGRTDIVMRSFRPVGFKDYEPTYTPPTVDDDFYDSEVIGKDRKKKPPDIKISVGDDDPKRNYLPMRHWGITKTPIKDYTVEDVDEDNIVYKPV